MYCYITILIDCIVALLVNSDVSLSVIYIIDDALGLDRPIECIDALVEPIDAPLTSELAVLSLD